MTDPAKVLGPLEDTAAPPSARRRRRFLALCSHSFLIVVAVTMLAPFVWMVLTALKPPGQAMQGNWLPTRDYVVVDGRERVVTQRARLKDGAGVYRVRLPAPAADGAREIEVSTDRLIPVGGSETHFLLTTGEGSATGTTSVKLIKKLVPEKFEVHYDGGAGQEPVTATMDETRIITRISPQWDNFRSAWTMSGVFGRAFINSLSVCILITLGQVFTSSLAAYAFARLEFPGRDKLFMAYLATMMVPGAVTMIPLFVILKSLPTVLNFLFHTDWFGVQLFVKFWLASPVRTFYAGRLVGLDSYFALIVPGLFSAYGTFMLRQFFLTIPKDLEDAARIDGCGAWGVYWNVIVPLSKPALAVLAILTFMGAWSDFMWPMVTTSTPEMQTLPVMLQAFMGITETQWELLMAGTLMVLGPVIVVFLIGQRYIIEGIRLGSVKG
ncbi:MAG: carbohydrate ABC transporter permease [Candidatus Brocadiia bacterium]|jgi:multiple sugar transport system permease protein